MLRKQHPIIQEISRIKDLREYKGYSGNAQLRKNSDETIRHYLTKSLRNSEDSLRHIQENAILVQCIIVWPDLDDLLRRLEKLNILIESTNYDTSTFFITKRIRDIEEEEIIFKMDELLHTESKILKQLDILQEKILKVGEEIDSGLYSDSSETVSEIRHAVDQIDENYNYRVDVIRKYNQMF